MSESSNSIWEGTETEFARRVQQLIAASGGRVSVISAYRSVERQAQLYEDGKRRYGANVNRWVAPPGRSNHNRGLAIDLRYADAKTKEWVHANAARFGLTFPMDHEPWHIEPIGVRDGSYKGYAMERDAYTVPPDGGTPVVDRPRTAKDHFQSMLGILMAPSMASELLAAPDAEPIAQMDESETLAPVVEPVPVRAPIMPGARASMMKGAS